MRPTKIFLDLDDVLNVFTPYVLWNYGCMIDKTDYSLYPKEAGYDIVQAARMLPGCRSDVTEEWFWSSINHNTWATVPKSDEFDLLLSLSEQAVGRDNVFILSKPTRSPLSLSGKLAWIQGVCPSWLHKQFLIGPPKYLCAAPDALLIDDYEPNVDKWEAHGGQAILFPRPWNWLREVAPAVHLMTMLDRCFPHIPSPCPAYGWDQ